MPVTDVGNVLAHTLSGYAPGTVLDVRVQAYNAAGDGPWSGWERVTVPAAPPSESELVTTFDSSSDLDLYPYRSGTWTVSGGSAVSTITGAAAHELRADHVNLHDGTFAVEMQAPSPAPEAGYLARCGVEQHGRREPTWHEGLTCFFEHDGWGFIAKMYVAGNWYEHYIGQYLQTAHRHARIRFPASGVPVFETSPDAATWTAHEPSQLNGAAYTGAWPTIPGNFSWKALMPFLRAEHSGATTPTTTSVLTLSATGPNTTDRSHIDPAPASLLASEDFNTALDTNKWEIDDQRPHPVYIANTNVVVENGAMSLKIANGFGARVNWGAWMPSPPPIARYGRYEFRMRYNENTWPGGMAVMIWPEYNNGDWVYGEIDVYEGDTLDAHSNLHWSPTADMVNDHRTYQASLHGDYTQWHIWTVEWTPDLYRIWIADGDGSRRRLVTYHNNWETASGIITTPAESQNHDIRMHLRFDDAYEGTGYVPDGTETGSLDIDYIRMYEIPGVTVTR